MSRIGQRRNILKRCPPPINRNNQLVKRLTPDVLEYTWYKTKQPNRFERHKLLKHYLKQVGYLEELIIRTKKQVVKFR